MILEGKYNSAKVFVDELDEGSQEQITKLLDQDFVKDSKVRIMPDVHRGMGCVIGFTADMGERVIPNIVGVDIGCGMLTVELGQMDINLKKLDEIVNKNIPSAYKTHNRIVEEFDRLEDLYCYRELDNMRRIRRSIGTLGGGNHFVELGEDSKGDKYLVIHSGSRNLGKQVADYYQDLAVELCSGREEFYDEKERIIEEYREKGKNDKIQKRIKQLEKQYKLTEADYPKDLCFLTGRHRDRYLNDMKICQEYASLNRKTMVNLILEELINKNVDDFNHFETVHNYIDFRDNVIRKGAISAYKDEKILIPINMRDGSILARGKGNEDWNNSAPHGAGRLLSRTQARKNHSLDKFKSDMEGIYTTSVNKRTLDENPDAYKSIDYILENLHETAEVIDIIKPIYNFKAS